MSYRYYNWSWGYPMGHPHPLIGLLIMVAGFGLYFLPSIIAVLRHHRQAAAIIVLNLLLGWSGLGWVGALVWSLTWPGPPR